MLQASDKELIVAHQLRLKHYSYAPLSQHRIHSHRRLIQNEQLGLVQQGDGKAHATLLAAAQILDEFRAIWQIEQFEQEFRAILDVAARYRRNEAKVD